MDKRKKPWYLQAWFICILFALWAAVLPPIIGVVLLILSSNWDKKEQIRFDEVYKKYAHIEDLDSYIANLIDRGAELEKDIEILSKDSLVQAVDIVAYESLKSDEVKNQLQLLKMKQSEMIKNESALDVQGAGKTKKVVSAQQKQILRCYNAETVSIIEAVTVKNVDASRNKLQRSFETINTMFAVNGVAISVDYHKTKLEELSMVYAYMVKVEQERELQREIREQLKEEEKVRREIEREKAKIEKEEAQFNGEISKLMGYMQKASDIDKQLYADKIRELEEKLKLLEKDKENVLQREQNTRAGFVYIISNIGSFGENVYKIGMTRRLEPMDRVKELGDASVPFEFDVHAMIFSEDAPTLETILHQTFRDYQVNKVNPRKEFFRIDLEKVKQIVKENYNATVHFVDVPDAEQYRETLRMESVASR